MNHSFHFLFHRWKTNAADHNVMLKLNEHYKKGKKGETQVMKPTQTNEQMLNVVIFGVSKMSN